MPCPLCGTPLERVAPADAPAQVAGLARGAGTVALYHCPRCDAWMGK